MKTAETALTRKLTGTGAGTVRQPLQLIALDIFQHFVRATADLGRDILTLELWDL